MEQTAGRNVPNIENIQYIVASFPLRYNFNTKLEITKFQVDFPLVFAI